MIDSQLHSFVCPDSRVKPTDRLTRYFLEARNDLLRFLRRRTDHAAAEDILQDVWLNLRERSDPNTWREPRAVLFTAAANLAIDARRRDKRADKVFARQQPESDAECPRPNPESEADAASNLERLNAVLAELPPLCRQAFLLNRLEALSHAEIGQRLGISTKSVQRYMERALQHCVQALYP